MNTHKTHTVDNILLECATLARVNESSIHVINWALPADSIEKLIAKLQRLEDLPNSLDRPLRIAICGENNAGKSSLINALVEEQIAVTDFMEFTFCPMVFSYDAEKQSHIEFTSGICKKIDFDQLPDELIKIKDDGEENTVERVVIRLPNERLRRFELADVPGLGANDRNAHIARSFTEKIDAGVFVMSAGLIGQSEMLEEITELGKEFSELAVVINKIDEIGFENTDRLLDYVREQKLGRDFQIFPMCAGLALHPQNNNPLVALWLSNFKCEYIGKIEAKAQLVQHQTALSKCERDLVASDSALQSAFHIGSRSLNIFSVLKSLLETEKKNLTDFIQSRIRTWINADGFYDAAAEARLTIKESGIQSKEDFQALLKNAFSDEVIDRESQAFSEYLHEIRDIAWSRVRAKAEEKLQELNSSFQLAKTLQLIEKQNQNPARASENGRSVTQIDSDVIGLTDSVVTQIERKLTGSLDEDDVGEAGAMGLTMGGGIAAAIAIFGTTVTTATAITGIGLPVAGVTGVVTLGAKWLGRRKRMKPETSFAELADITNQLRRSTALKVVEAYLSEDVDQSIHDEVEQQIRSSIFNAQETLWGHSHSQCSEDLSTLRSTIDDFETAIDQVRLVRNPEDNHISTTSKRLSPAAKQADVICSRSRKVMTEHGPSCLEELQSIFCLEDTCLSVFDRRLSGYDLEWLRDSIPKNTFLRAFLYDAERDPETRNELGQSLQFLRSEKKGEIAARVIKIKNQDRTPLDRILVIGSDWALEFSDSLNQIGSREVTFRKLNPDEEDRVRLVYLKQLGSIQALEDCVNIEILDI